MLGARPVIDHSRRFGHFRCRITRELHGRLNLFARASSMTAGVAVYIRQTISGSVLVDRQAHIG